MIYLGNINKEEIIHKYIKKNSIKKVFILSPDKFYFDIDLNNVEFIEWKNIIMYKFFYRLLQEIDKNTLIVINECLRKQNRYDLTYNCIRHFLNQTNHQIIFQYIPIISNINDLFILFDFDTKTKWKGQIDINLLKNCTIIKNEIKIKINEIKIKTDELFKNKYEKQKNKLINNIGLKDPDTIPRNLYLMSGKYKVSYVIPNKYYIGRNNRFKLDNFFTFKEIKYDKKYIIFELCHNFLNFIDFVSLSKQNVFDILIADVKVDRWYLERYNNWIRELEYVYSII